MAQREPSPVYTVVDIDEYEENVADRVPVEDILASNEVYVFYARVHKISHAAIRAHVSASVESAEPNGIRALGSITFRDVDFSPATPDYEFPGLFHARFFVPNSASPILVRPGLVMKRPIEMGFLVREDEGYDDELLEDMALPSLDRDQQLVSQ